MWRRESLLSLGMHVKEVGKRQYNKIQHARLPICLRAFAVVSLSLEIGRCTIRLRDDMREATASTGESLRAIYVDTIDLAICADVNTSHLTVWYTWRQLHDITKIGIFLMLAAS